MLHHMATSTLLGYLQIKWFTKVIFSLDVHFQRQIQNQKNLNSIFIMIFLAFTESQNGLGWKVSYRSS